MGGSRNCGAFFWPHRVRKIHEWRWVRTFEIVRRSFLENRRSKRAENLAMLDSLIQHVLHLRPPGIDDYASIAQRTRSPFCPALEPADDLSGGDVLRCNSYEFFAGILLNRTTRFGSPAILQSLPDRFRRELRSPIRVVHHERAWASENLVIDVVGGADGQSSVACRGLNVNIV